jgi:transcription elongation GreA/GreB family factor
MRKILLEDLILLDERVKTLQQEIFALGEEFEEAVTQSSETWHDNAPFDFARDKQSLLQQELLQLRMIRRESLKYAPKRTVKVQIGSKVILGGPRELKIMIGGNWVGRSMVDGYKLITCEAPIALLLLGKKVGDEVELPGVTSRLHHIH